MKLATFRKCIMLGTATGAGRAGPDQLRSVRRSVAKRGLVFCTLVVACSGGSSEPTGLTGADANGTWALTFASACGSPSSTIFYVTLGFRDDGQTGDVGSYWVIGTGSLQRAATGQIRFSDGQVDVHLWGTRNQSAVRLSGTMRRGGEFTGTARDPAPGYSSVFSFGTCDFTVSGRRQ